MREILFRGKRKDNGKWEEGYYRVGSWHKNHMIDSAHSPYSSEVTPDTVGQYTGLNDKNGVKIFEWDIVKTDFFDKPAVVYFDHGTFITSGMYLTETHDETMIVIGNYFDNPELLEGKDA